MVDGAAQPAVASRRRAYRRHVTDPTGGPPVRALVRRARPRDLLPERARSTTSTPTSARPAHRLHQRARRRRAGASTKPGRAERRRAPARRPGRGDSSCIPGRRPRRDGAVHPDGAMIARWLVLLAVVLAVVVAPRAAPPPMATRRATRCSTQEASCRTTRTFGKPSARRSCSALRRGRRRQKGFPIKVARDLVERLRPRLGADRSGGKPQTLRRSSSARRTRRTSSKRYLLVVMPNGYGVYATRARAGGRLGRGREAAAAEQRRDGNELVDGRRAGR